MQGATLNVTGVCVVSNLTKGKGEGWYNAELLDAPATNSSFRGSDREVLPLRASFRVAQGVTPPTNGALVEIRGAILNKTLGTYKSEPTPFHTVTIFTWKELDSPVATETKPVVTVPVATASTSRRPVMDDTEISDDWGTDDVPF